MKECRISLVIKEMEIKITTGHYNICTVIAIIKITDHIRCHPECEAQSHMAREKRKRVQPFWKTVGQVNTPTI